MWNVEGIVNAGYEIKACVYIKEAGMGYAIGVKYSTFTRKTTYVTWAYNFMIDDETNTREPRFFWGHYIEDIDTAHIDYLQRIKNLCLERIEMWKHYNDN